MRVCVWEDRNRCWVLCLNHCCLSSPWLQRGRRRHWKNLIYLTCTVVTLPSHQLSSFLSSLPSPFPFLFHAQWKCLVRCPPFQKLFHPCLHSFKNCFLHPPSVLVFICAGPLDLPRLKKKRQRKPATASFTCFSSLFSHLLSPLHFFYYCFCYYYYCTSNKLPNQILLLICHSQYYWRSQRVGDEVFRASFCYQCRTRHIQETNLVHLKSEWGAFYQSQRKWSNRYTSSTPRCLCYKSTEHLIKRTKISLGINNSFFLHTCARQLPPRHGTASSACCRASRYGRDTEKKLIPLVELPAVL